MNKQQINEATPKPDKTSPKSYDEVDLDEFCLWLYGIYEELTIKLD